MTSHVYTGRRDGLGAHVCKDGQPLLAERSLRARRHSPDGFNWGYGGSGPAQLALALLLEETGADEAQRRYQSFKFGVIAGLQRESWTLDSAAIQDWLAQDRAARPLPETEESCAE